jgi:predicted ATPase
MAAQGHHTQITLNRLSARNVREMIVRVATHNVLTSETVDTVVQRTSGVPLFVEELTRSVLESGDTTLTRGKIPATLHDSLLARLDRLGSAKEVAQIAAVIGNDFSYELLRSVAGRSDANLQTELKALCDTELVYVQGLPPTANYSFKHALIQEAAYEALLKTRRRELHNRVAESLSERYPEIAERQPELLARHYTAAGHLAEAISYWQKAGQIAIGRSASIEAISHLTAALDLLENVADTPERAQQELNLQIALATSLMAVKGWAAPEVERASGRARDLCRQVGESSQLLQTLWALWNFFIVRADLRTAYELAEQFMHLAESTQDSMVLMQAHFMLGDTLFWSGDFSAARPHLEQDGARGYLQVRRSNLLLYGLDPGVACLSHGAWVLWLLGYADRALESANQALGLARELSHPFSLAWAVFCIAVLHQQRRECQATKEQAEHLITLATEQGFSHWVVLGTVLRSWAISVYEHSAGELEPMRQSLATWQAMGAVLERPHCLSLLAEACGVLAETKEGLVLIDEALAAVNNTGERYYEAELHRCKGELELRQVNGYPRSLTVDAELNAEVSIKKAIQIASAQHAKAWQLRATTSLARLLAKQAHRDEARAILAEIYDSFTEGFDTADLKDAKALFDELSV